MKAEEFMRKISHEELSSILKSQESRGPNWYSSLSEVDLSQIDLSSGFNKAGPLVGINLEGRDLRKTQFSWYADIRIARLSYVLLDESILNFCILEGTDLNYASLSNASMESTRMERVNLFMAYLPNANLKLADLEGSDLRGADLSMVDLSWAHINRADLTMALLSGANLNNADLRGADLSDTDFANAEVTDANFMGARYTEDTKWPKGFNPKKAGAILMENSQKIKFIKEMKKMLDNN